MTNELTEYIASLEHAITYVAETELDLEVPTGNAYDYLGWLAHRSPHADTRDEALTLRARFREFADYFETDPTLEEAL